MIPFSTFATQMRPSGGGLLAATQHKPKLPENIQPIPLTTAEIRKLFANFIVCIKGTLAVFVLHWSNWRRRHQAVARYWHWEGRRRELQL